MTMLAFTPGTTAPDLELTADERAVTYRHSSREGVWHKTRKGIRAIDKICFEMLSDDGVSVLAYEVEFGPGGWVSV